MKPAVNSKTLFVGISTVICLLLASLNLFERLAQKPLADDGVIWQSAAQGLRVQYVRPGSAADRAGLVPGDILRALDFDGQPIAVDADWQVQYYLDEKIGIGGKVTYLVECFNPLGLSKGLWAAELYDIGTQPSRFTIDLYLGFIGLIYLLIGLFVFHKQDQTPQTLHFYFICLLSFLYLVLSPSGDFDWFDKLVSLIDNAALTLLCPVFLHFCSQFPRPSPWLEKHPWATRILYVPALFLIGLEITHLTLGKENLNLLEIRPWLNTAEIAHFTLFFISSASVVIVTFTQTRASILRQQIKWIVWGLSLGIFPWTIFYAYPYLAGMGITPLMTALAVGPTVFIPLAFGYSIVRYRLMDVDIIVRRSMTYALATLSVIVLFMLGVVKSAEWTRELFPSISNSAMTVLQVAVMSCGAMLYSPLKNWLQERIDRMFYGDKYNYRRGIADFGRTLSTTTSLPDLLDAVADRLTEMLAVDDLAIFVQTNPHSHPLFRLAYAKGNALVDSLPPEVDRFLRQYISHQTLSLRSGRISRTYINPEGTPLTSPEYDRSTPAVLSHFLPCIVRDQIVAVIGLGRTQDRTLLSSEDLDLLYSLTPYVAVAIENSLLYQSELERTQELALLKEFNENIIESINVGILTVDPQGQITNCNSAFEELFSVSREQAEGQSVEQLFDADLVQTMRDVTGGVSWALSDVRNIYRYRATTRTDEPLVLNINLSPLKTKDEAVTGALIAFEDITSRVRLEEQLRENDKLSSIGLLAAGVAHEVNTPLTGISSYTQMLLTQTPSSDVKHSILEKIHRQTIRASDIVNNLLNFSRTGNASFSQLSIAKLLDDTLQLLELQIRNTRIEIVREYSHTLPPVLGQAGKLQQVFLNLILNARDAMPDGGTLRISASVHEDSLVVDFADTGEGIPSEYIAKIYDPFFTTKEVGRGTGLGLAVSYGIIQEHSGRIFVESEPGHGTCFRVKLPCQIHHASFQAVGD